MPRLTERITVRLSKDLKARAKLKAAAEGCSLNSLIEEGLCAVLGEGKGVDGRVKPGHDDR